MKKLYLLMFALLLASVSVFNSCKPKDPDGDGDDFIYEFADYKIFNNLESSNWTYFIFIDVHNQLLINDYDGDFESLYGFFFSDTVYITSNLEDGIFSIDFNNAVTQFIFQGDSVMSYSNEIYEVYPFNDESEGSRSGISNGDVLDFLSGKILEQLPVPVVNALEVMKLMYGLEYADNTHQQLNYILDGGYKLIPPDLFDWADKKKNDFKSNPLYFIGIKTGSAEVNGTSAKCYVDGYLRADGNGVSYDFDYGICYSSSSSVPTIEEYLQYKREVPFSPGNPMSITLTLPISFVCSNLEPGTKYYYRAFFKDNITGMVDYAEEIKSFTTEEGTCDPDGEIAGHGYVDLGLPSGLKWATCNVGATSAEDYGDYFAWGETSPKAIYTDNTYQHWNDADGNGIWEYGESAINSDISGNAQYDAATANWGGSWRMPSEDEMQELVNHCEWEWTEVNGVNGAKVIGPNGRCIFLPAAGLRYGPSLDGGGDIGHYWSSTPYYYHLGYYAYRLFFGGGGEHVDYDGRYIGFTLQ